MFSIFITNKVTLLVISALFTPEAAPATGVITPVITNKVSLTLIFLTLLVIKTILIVIFSSLICVAVTLLVILTALLHVGAPALAVV
jgi:hypothetical protein